MNLANKRQLVELGDIFRAYGAEYRASRVVPTHQLVAMSAIERCRTQALGGHLQECDRCGAEVPAYDSCGNRHCPKPVLS